MKISAKEKLQDVTQKQRNQKQIQKQRKRRKVKNESKDVNAGTTQFLQELNKVVFETKVSTRKLQWFVIKWNAFDQITFEI